MLSLSGQTGPCLERRAKGSEQEQGQGKGQTIPPYVSLFFAFGLSAALVLPPRPGSLPFLPLPVLLPEWWAMTSGQATYSTSNIHFGSSPPPHFHVYLTLHCSGLDCHLFRTQHFQESPDRNGGDMMNWTWNGRGWIEGTG